MFLKKYVSNCLKKAQILKSKVEMNVFTKITSLNFGTLLQGAFPNTLTI